MSASDDICPPIPGHDRASIPGARPGTDQVHEVGGHVDEAAGARRGDGLGYARAQEEVGDGLHTRGGARLRAGKRGGGG